MGEIDRRLARLEDQHRGVMTPEERLAFQRAAVERAKAHLRALYPDRSPPEEGDDDAA